MDVSHCDGDLENDRKHQDVASPNTSLMEATGTDKSDNVEDQSLEKTKHQHKPKRNIPYFHERTVLAFRSAEANRGCTLSQLAEILVS